MKKLDAEPRLQGAIASVVEWARKVVLVVNANSDETVKSDAALTTLIAQAAPPTLVGLFAANSAPPGWLKANGAAVSRTAYAALFAAIGTTFGAGNGTTTFNLPDLRGEFPRGWDDGRGVDTGRVFGSSQLDAFQGFGLKVYALTTAAGTNNLFYNFSSTVNANSGALAGLTHFEARDAIANGFGTPRAASETRGRNVALLACIKY
ncbi:MULTISPECIES: phage tail protein [unclassified Variovorax]|uniref:phage tail protein n=1 Tax=unclassified Variovorax TaxID=663243 RepID=UPI0008952E02|nr:Phage Tail Collar Domain [Variovorax sp. NFACC28]SEF71668.1 Phage Tail Collar Domain [Variovorax sp. NFACC29]SFB76922.1 Phage Tail Collar Domain [Variovorax sp. NFACC26]SFG76548.1 Phage Tail Collar Domain [Variovorax sp. NFACC27]